MENVPNGPIFPNPARLVNNHKPAREEPAKDEIQPGLINFTVYRCLKCDKMIMGYDRNNHINEVHEGNEVKLKKMR
jgi:hypothetical protein